MATVFDKEFGEIKIRKSKLARNIKLSVAVDGSLRASVPYYSPEFAVSRIVNHSRDEIRRMVSEHSMRNIYKDGDLIGKSHTLIFRKSDKFKIETSGNQIIVYGDDVESTAIQNEIRKHVSKILRKQAKAYLARRIEFLAQKHGFIFEKLRFSHTGTRWGSCSSSGTISLNIALMNLPFELIDYVIIHELCHTREMNHSDRFWREVAKYDNNFQRHVREMKKYSPHI